MLHPFEICLLTRKLGKARLVEALFFDEVCRLGTSERRLVEGVIDSLRPGLEQTPPAFLHRYQKPGEISLASYRVGLAGWRAPVVLEFQAACYCTSTGQPVAYFPDLGLEVFAESHAQLEERVPEELRAALGRLGVARSLGELARLERPTTLSVSTQTMSLSVAGLKERLRHNETEDKRSVLADVATDLRSQKLSRAYEAEEGVAQLAEMLGRSQRSVLLCGPSGCGKTALFHQLVLERSRHNLGATPFYETTGARLVAGTDGFGMWQERCKDLCLEAGRERAVIHLGNLVELTESGKSEANPQGVAGFLRPYLVRGELTGIAECTPEQMARLEETDPHLLSAFHSLNVKAPTREHGLSILFQCALEWGGEERVSLEGVEKLDSLHRRYAAYSAYPGRPLRFLRGYLEAGDRALSPVQVARAFAAETGLPPELIDDSQAVDLAAAHAFFARRVLGQPEAVDLVVDLVAGVKAALSRPGRPIATLLLIGPTGVGKTETARTLAEYLFGDRRRMVRFDMSEFSDPFAVERLIGSEGLLTSRVRANPFSVVLFDELEKSDPSFFDLLLQVLGEGRLTDRLGRVADFSNCVVLMTSNLGAESFRREGLGFITDRGGSDAARQHFTAAVREAFRPELFNRIDKVVPFAPLTRETVVAIAARELEGLRGRDGIRNRPVELHLEEGLAQHLATAGYSARLGARELKRSLTRSVLLPVARELAVRSLERPVRVTVDAERVMVRELPPDRKREAGAALVNRAAEQRRRAQRLASTPAAVELENEIFQLERLAGARGARPDPEQARWLEALPHRRELLEALRTLEAHSAAVEEELFLEVYRDHPGPAGESNLAELEQRFDRLLLDLYGLGFEHPNLCGLAISGRSNAVVKKLAELYLGAARLLGLETRAEWLGAYPGPDGPGLLLFWDGRWLPPDQVDDLDSVEVQRLPLETLDNLSPRALGVLLEVRGELVSPRFEAEAGVHVFREGDREQTCEVAFWEGEPNRFTPRAGFHRSTHSEGARRRFYNLGLRRMDDPRLEAQTTWTGRDPSPSLLELLEQALEQAAREQVFD